MSADQAFLQLNNEFVSQSALDDQHHAETAKATRLSEATNTLSSGHTELRETLDSLQKYHVESELPPI